MWLRSATYCLSIVVAVHSCSLRAQAAPSRRAPSLQEFFESILRNPGSLPTWQEYDPVDRSIASAPAGDISNALPAIAAALATGNNAIQHYAAGALIAISTRRDSAPLLKNYVRPISVLLQSPDERLQAGALAILSMLKPVPPPEIVPPLLDYLSRADVDPHNQAGVVNTLLRFRPDDPTIVEAVAQFASRPLDRSTRVHLMDAIHISRANDPRIVQIVIRALDDSYSGVILAAIQALDRMGPTALAKAEPRLQQLAKSDAEPAEVKAAASKALNTFGVRAP